MTGTPGDQGKDLAAGEMDLGNKKPGFKAGSCCKSCKGLFPVIWFVSSDVLTEWDCIVVPNVFFFSYVSLTMSNAG